MLWVLAAGKLHLRKKIQGLWNGFMLFKVHLLSANLYALQCAKSYEKYKGRVRMGSDPRLHLHRGHRISGVKWVRAKRKKRESTLAETVWAKALRWQCVTYLCQWWHKRAKESHCTTVLFREGGSEKQDMESEPLQVGNCGTMSVRETGQTLPMCHYCISPFDPEWRKTCSEPPQHVADFSQKSLCPIYLERELSIDLLFSHDWYQTLQQ